ncbi:MAG: arginine N-succinyltransferase [Pseudomonadota bacterium]|nr:arginine N-succinyltransferase [Pseudomonadota bacterium]
MWRVRPAQLDDLQLILEIAIAQNARLSSTLPEQETTLAERIQHSVESLRGSNPKSQPKRVLFVLENTDTGQIAGTAGIDTRAGNGHPFYNYRRDNLIHASHELNVSRRVEVLYPSHALTDLSLLCAYSLAPELRDTEVAELLSRARMLFMAEHRDWFTSKTVVELQGIQHDNGAVPFWDSLGRHFFNMDFETADLHSGQLSKTFIAELMPPNPIYVTLLSDEAQEALGQPHPLTAANHERLQREGFQPGSYVDIFDGGPVLEVRTDTLKTLVTSQIKTLHATERDDGEAALIAAGSGERFRCVLSPMADALGEDIHVPLATWHALGAGASDRVRTAPV